MTSMLSQSQKKNNYIGSKREKSNIAILLLEISILIGCQKLFRILVVPMIFFVNCTMYISQRFLIYQNRYIFSYETCYGAALSFKLRQYILGNNDIPKVLVEVMCTIRLFISIILNNSLF